MLAIEASAAWRVHKSAGRPCAGCDVSSRPLQGEPRPRRSAFPSSPRILTARTFHLCLQLPRTHRHVARAGEMLSRCAARMQVSPWPDGAAGCRDREVQTMEHKGLLIFGALKPVAQRWLSDDEPGIAWIRLDLGAKTTYEAANQVHASICVNPPHALDDDLRGNGLSPV